MATQPMAQLCDYSYEHYSARTLPHCDVEESFVQDYSLSDESVNHYSFHLWHNLLLHSSQMAFIVTGNLPKRTYIVCPLH